MSRRCQWKPGDLNIILIRGNDPAGRPYFWTKHVASEIRNLNGTDVSAVEHGKIAVTPMTYDLTDYGQIDTEECR